MNNMKGNGFENWRVAAAPLYVRVKERLIDMVRRGEFVNNRLPPESVLAERMRVSRTTIREALIALSKEGIISKRHGIGNLIHNSTLDTIMRIDRHLNFVTLLQEAGYQVRVERLTYAWIAKKTNNNPLQKNQPKNQLPQQPKNQLPQQPKNQLPQQPENQLPDLQPDKQRSPQVEEQNTLFIEVCYYTDENPAIRALVFVPAERLVRDPIHDSKLYNSLPEFLNKYSIEPVSHSLCYFKPAIADIKTAERLNLAHGDPIMAWEESFFSIFDTELAQTEISFNPSIVSFSLLRKWE